MGLELNVAKVKELISSIAETSENEYKLSLRIYNDQRCIDKYKKLLFNGVIQHFSILSLRQIVYVLQSVQLKSQTELMSEATRGVFLQPLFFEKNILSMLDVALNKLATVLKYRFTKPDGRFAADIQRIYRQIKGSSDFCAHKSKEVLHKLVGSKSYNNFRKLRGASDHGYEPKYRSDLYNVFSVKDMVEISDYITRIIECIYSELETLTVTFDDSDIDKYKIKIIDPISIPETSWETLFQEYKMQFSFTGSLINITMNYLDVMDPWLRRRNIEKNLVDLLMGIQSDINFRVNDTLRSFAFFVSLYSGKLLVSRDSCEIVKDVGYEYFMNTCCIRLISIYDKIGLFFSRIFSMPKDKTYFKAVVKWFDENLGEEYAVLKQKCNAIVSSNEFKALDIMRQQYVHGLDLDVRQYEGTQFSHEYILLTLYHNIRLQNDFLKYVVFELFPAESKPYLYYNFGVSLVEVTKVFDRVHMETNPYMSKLHYVKIPHPDSNNESK